VSPEICSEHIPSFNDNFDAEKGITNEDLKNQLLGIIGSIEL
jgi:hypothetical protein